MRSAPRVVHLVDSLEIGGLERLVHDMTVARGPESTSVACLTSIGLFGESLRRLGTRIEYIGTEGGLVPTVWRLQKHLRAMRPDVLHCHNIRQVLVGSCAAALGGGMPVVLTKHGIATPTGTVARRIYRYFLRRAYVVAVSGEARQIMSEWMGAGPHAVRYIANGIAMEPYRNLPSREEAQKALGLRPSSFVVGTVSRIAHCKNHLLLIDIFHRLLQDFPDALLLVAGDGPELPAVERRIQERGVQSSVVMLGSRSDIPLVLAAMDVFCLPSETEGMPMTVLEAMAASRPVVASRVGGIPELLIEGSTGLMASPDGPGEFVAALSALARDPERAAEMGRVGNARLLDNFSLDATLAAYENLYQQAISGVEPY